MPIIKKNKNPFFKSKIVLLVSIIVLIFFLIGLIREILNRREINNQINDLEGQISELQSQNGQVSELINSWQDGSHLEKEARLRLGLQKPGEKAVIISKPDLQTNTSPQQAVSIGDQADLAMTNNKPVDNPRKWVHYFFK